GRFNLKIEAQWTAYVRSPKNPLAKSANRGRHESKRARFRHQPPRSSFYRGPSFHTPAASHRVYASARCKQATHRGTMDPRSRQCRVSSQRGLITASELEVVKCSSKSLQS